MMVTLAAAALTYASGSERSEEQDYDYYIITFHDEALCFFFDPLK